MVTKISELTELAATPSSGDFIPILDTTAGSTKKVSYGNLASKVVAGLVSNPQAMYLQRAQVVMFRAPYALTITRIHIHCSDTSPTAELAGDLKFADDINVGGFANATVIDICDTTSGVFTVTSGMDDATVPSGKYIYFSMDASPHADIKDLYIEFHYTAD